jgi:hypothetical protein
MVSANDATNKASTAFCLSTYDDHSKLVSSDKSILNEVKISIYHTMSILNEVRLKVMQAASFLEVAAAQRLETLVRGGVASANLKEGKIFVFRNQG